MGYAAIKKYETFTFEEKDAEDDELPFSARIRRSLSGDEIRVLTEGVTIRTPASDLYPRLAPHFQSWAMKAENTETGKIESVPVPTEDQYDQLGLVPDAIVWAIYGRLRSGPERRVAEESGN